MYREAGDAPCYKCDRATREVCITCQQPTCARHLDARRMCSTCDEALYRHMRADDSGIVTFGLPLFIVGSIVLGLLVPAVVPVAVAVPFVGFPALLVIRKRRRRAMFFRLMRERGALPAPTHVDPDHAEADRLVARLEKDLRKRK